MRVHMRIDIQRNRDAVCGMRAWETVLEMVAFDSLIPAPLNEYQKCGERGAVLTESCDRGCERTRCTTEVLDERRDVHANCKHEEEAAQDTQRNED